MDRRAFLTGAAAVVAAAALPPVGDGVALTSMEHPVAADFISVWVNEDWFWSGPTNLLTQARPGDRIVGIAMDTVGKIFKGDVLAALDGGRLPLDIFEEREIEITEPRAGFRIRK